MHLFRSDEDPFGVAKKYQSLTRAEWAKVGSRLKPDAGNATCSRCDADYFLEDDVIVPLQAGHDPYGFIAEYHGCRLDFESIRYLGVLKASGRPGPVCGECRTEFDEEGDYLRLRSTNNDLMSAHIDEARPFEDWHRIALGLPAIDEEAEWHTRFEQVLRDALLSGEVPWADRRKPEIIWRSDSELIGVGARGRMILFVDRLEFQNRKHGWSAPLDAIRQAEIVGDHVQLAVVGQPEPLTVEIVPETVAVDLKSGRRQLVLEATDFAAAVRMSKEARVE
jgi:hypothetical protein